MIDAAAGMQRSAFATLLDTWLVPRNFADVAENGLQVQGRAQVSRVVCGVSANLAFIDAAIATGADTLIVHHGLVWGGIKRIDGWLHARIASLMRHDVNLFAYHLPLDAQPTFGNNAQLAGALGITQLAPFGAYKGQLIGTAGVVEPTSFRDVVARVHERVGAPLCAFGAMDRTITRVGVCTGGAPELLHDAITAGLDLYITGEATEWVKAVADESGTCFVAAGHHHTERFGPRALAQQLKAHGIDASFIDVDNPA